ncbi:MAG: ModD protein [Zoogloeaceae bacterium]|nr:ModD protein [Zoogloeaceae bacterium]
MYLSLDDAELARLLSDDVPFEDITTRALAIGSLPGRVEFRARGDMTVCGGEEAARLFALAGASARLLVPSGGVVADGTCLLQAQGSATCLHRAWKTAQVTMETLSGIATSTAAIVAAASPTPVACTRKSVPGTKALGLKAVRAGGATIHRLGLSDSVLVFPEHRIFLDEVPAETIARLRRAEPERKLVVEVKSAPEAMEWAAAGADILQLEKFAPEAVAAVREDLGRRGLDQIPLLAAAGGIRADNARRYAAAGADVLVTSAPFAAPPADVQVDFTAGSG